MDPRKQQELRKRLPFPLDPQVTVADHLPLGAERLIGGTILVASYYLLFMWLFWLSASVLAWSLGPNSMAGLVSGIIARSIGIGYLICLGWNLLWFLVYVVFDMKDRRTLARIPGAPADLEDLAEEAPAPRPGVTAPH
ncbi:MAG TPA: hypothetical protein VEI97_05415 [bacterium]|nr:hypothetical protein [bacterium]